MSHLLALDPGLRNPAVALFRDNVLVHASRVKIPTATHKLPLGERIAAVAKLVRDHVERHLPTIALCDAMVSEWPRTYRRMKGDPADLFPLAGLGMYVAGMAGLPVDAPTAPEWIGNIPKSTTGDPLQSARGQRIWSRLSEAERACVTLSHDSLDAVGLGLWKLGRLERRTNFIGATHDA